MKLTEIVTLAKAGYKMAEIKELEAREQEELEKQKEEPKDKPKDSDEVPKDEKPEDDELDEEEEPKEVDEYKKKYEELLALTQKKNISRDVSGNEKSDEEIINDIVRSYM